MSLAWNRMRFPWPQSPEALPGAGAPAMCSGAINFLPQRLKLPRHLLKESQPASAVFSNKAWWEKGHPVWGGQVPGENGWFLADRGCQKLFPGSEAEEEGIKSSKSFT